MHPDWRLIRSPALPGAMNMAFDEALLESVAAGRSGPVLRLYRWDPPAVSLGYGQSLQRVNLPACRELGLDVVRRLTGGRAVLHHREVTYAVIAPERTALFPGGVLDNYRVIAGVLLQALQTLGLTAEIVGRAGRSRIKGGVEGACFIAPAHFEIVCAGRKIAGSAQRRQSGAFLQHGSILLDFDPLPLFCALDTRGEISEAAGVRSLTEEVGWVNCWLDPPVTADQLEEQLIAAFEQRLGLHFSAGEPTSQEIGRAAVLQAKYARLLQS